jgi:hypothetical protein
MISMKLIKIYSACKVVIVICIQELEEPGHDTRRYDTLCPTVVKPKSRVLIVSAGRIEIFKSHKGQFNLLVLRDVNCSFVVLFVTRST